jgi:uncharacterized membrane protein
VTAPAAIPARSAASHATTRPHRLEHAIGRVLTIGTIAGVAMLAIGVFGMAVAGTPPLMGGPRLDAPAMVRDIVALRPEGFLWAGLIVLIATPSARVAASLVGFAAAHDRRMTLVAVAVLAVIAVSVAVGSGAA